MQGKRGSDRISFFSATINWFIAARVKRTLKLRFKFKSDPQRVRPALQNAEKRTRGK